jgi:hypothetical protein
MFIALRLVLSPKLLWERNVRNSWQTPAPKSTFKLFSLLTVASLIKPDFKEELYN